MHLKFLRRYGVEFIVQSFNGFSVFVFAPNVRWNFLFTRSFRKKMKTIKVHFAIKISAHLLCAKFAIFQLIELANSEKAFRISMLLILAIFMHKVNTLWHRLNSLCK